MYKENITVDEIWEEIKTSICKKNGNIHIYIFNCNISSCDLPENLPYIKYCNIYVNGVLETMQQKGYEILDTHRTYNDTFMITYK